MSSFFCQASGTIIMTASCSVRPFMSRNSSTLSKTPESELSGSTTGNSSPSRSPKCSDFAMPSRAFIQFMLPRSVLISPLWDMKRFGCARSQLGNVFVEKRECTMARCEV